MVSLSAGPSLDIWERGFEFMVIFGLFFLLSILLSSKCRISQPAISCFACKSDYFLESTTEEDVTLKKMK